MAISLGEKQRLFYRISGEATDRFSSGAARATLENSQSLSCEYILLLLCSVCVCVESEGHFSFLGQ